MMTKRILLFLFLLCITASGLAQKDTLSYDIKDDEIVAKLSRSLLDDELKDRLLEFSLNLESLRALMNQEKGARMTDSGWELERWDDRFFYFSKKQEKVKGSFDLLDFGMFWGDSPADQEKRENFTYNEFSEHDVSSSNGQTSFVLRGYPNAKQVFLSGSFNEWKVVDIAMEKRQGNWHVSIPLKPGNYEYKFIVDGEWKNHESNLRTVPNGQWGVNNRYSVCNHRFELKDYPSAQKVVLSGSFNNWDEEEIELQQGDDGWFLDVFVQDGSYEYKYIIDGFWVLDPRNNQTREDGEGNTNSLLNIGESSTFELEGFRDAQKVVLTGDFIGWDENAYTMRKTDKGWRFDVVLAPGNYQYKFIVDDHYTLDPNNPLTLGEGDFVNNLKVVQANFTFTYPASPSTKDVRISGDFLAWMEQGIRLQCADEECFVSLHLAKGKFRYKFLVNGNWTLDPNNPLYEQNEYGTGNSILWVE